MQHWYDSAINLEPVQVTAATLHRMVPNCSQPSLWADALGTRLTTAEIESNHEVALFLAHAGHESASFRQLEESLNYSTEALHKLFGAHRITRLEIETLGRKKNQQANQVGLGNVLYGGEWGKANLGNVYPGDGYNFRGRGIFQLTGRYNYAQCADQTGLDLVNDPDLLSSDPVAAVISAIWYWQTFITGNDVRSTTKQVNGGYHGLPDRIQRYKRALAVLEDV
jgi:putative chitinase